MANLSKDAYSSGQYSFFGNYFLGYFTLNLSIQLNLPAPPQFKDYVNPGGI